MFEFKGRSWNCPGGSGVLVLPQLPTQQPATSNGPRERHHSLAAASAPQWSYYVPRYIVTPEHWPPDEGICDTGQKPSPSGCFRYVHYCLLL